MQFWATEYVKTAMTLPELALLSGMGAGMGALSAGEGNRGLGAAYGALGGAGGAVLGHMAGRGIPGQPVFVPDTSHTMPGVLSGLGAGIGGMGGGMLAKRQAEEVG